MFKILSISVNINLIYPDMGVCTQSIFFYLNVYPITESQSCEYSVNAL